MKTLKIYISTRLDKISIWVDKNLGYFLTNPHNKWRWKERHKPKKLKD